MTHPRPRNALPRPERRLPATTCRALLTQHHEGRLGYRSGRGPRSVVVRYATLDDRIVFRVPDYNEIAQYAPGSWVTLEVDAPGQGGVDAGSVAEVTVGGVAAPLAEPRDADRLGLEHWPEGVTTDLIELPLTHLEGVERSRP
jgi:hypothetical protein